MMVASQGLGTLDRSTVEVGEAVVDSLRLIWAYESERGASSKLEGGAKVYGGKTLLARDQESWLEEEEGSASFSWMSFVNFC